MRELFFEKMGIIGLLIMMLAIPIAFSTFIYSLFSFEIDVWYSVLVGLKAMGITILIGLLILTTALLFV